MKRTKAARGRPPLPEGEAKTQRLDVRCSAVEGARIAYLAATHGMTVSEWVLARASTTGAARTAKAPTPKDGR